MNWAPGGTGTPSSASLGAVGSAAAGAGGAAAVAGRAGAWAVRAEAGRGNGCGVCAKVALDIITAEAVSRSPSAFSIATIIGGTRGALRPVLGRLSDTSNWFPTKP